MDNCNGNHISQEDKSSSQNGIKPMEEDQTKEINENSTQLQKQFSYTHDTESFSEIYRGSQKIIM